jgi:hypothetical protein
LNRIKVWILRFEHDLVRRPVATVRDHALDVQSHATEAIYIIAALATAGVILRPFNLAEAVWAVAGAALLVALGLISIPDALTGAAKAATFICSCSA